MFAVVVSQQLVPVIGPQLSQQALCSPTITAIRPTVIYLWLVTEYDTNKQQIDVKPSDKEAFNKNVSWAFSAVNRPYAIVNVMSAARSHPHQSSGKIFRRPLRQ